MDPANCSAGQSKRLPIETPRNFPKRLNKNENTPIINIGNKRSLNIVTPIEINEKPTAKASILVAMANVNNRNGFEGLNDTPSFLLWKPFQIILLPKKVSKPNEIQWSKVDI